MVPHSAPFPHHLSHLNIYIPTKAASRATKEFPIRAHVCVPHYPHALRPCRYRLYTRTRGPAAARPRHTLRIENSFRNLVPDRGHRRRRRRRSCRSCRESEKKEKCRRARVYLSVCIIEETRAWILYFCWFMYIIASAVTCVSVCVCLCVWVCGGEGRRVEGIILMGSGWWMLGNGGGCDDDEISYVYSGL